ncbi:MAG TPA: CopG family transcriptional regulator [Actinomycetota bacterium]
MKRTTVKLPDDLDALLRDEARRRGVSMSDVTREAIEAYLIPRGPRRLSFVGAGASTDGRSIAEHFDEIYAEAMEERFRRKMGRDS